MYRDILFTWLKLYIYIFLKVATLNKSDSEISTSIKFSALKQPHPLQTVKESLVLLWGCLPTMKVRKQHAAKMTARTMRFRAATPPFTASMLNSRISTPGDREASHSPLGFTQSKYSSSTRNPGCRDRMTLLTNRHAFIHSFIHSGFALSSAYAISNAYI